MACLTKEEYLERLKKSIKDISNEELKLAEEAYEMSQGNGSKMTKELRRLNKGFISSEKFVMPHILYTKAQIEDDVNDRFTTAMYNSNRYVSNLIIGGVLPITSTYGGIAFDAFDTWAIENLPLYNETKDMVSDTWNSNEFVKQLRTYLNPKSLGDLWFNLNTLGTLATTAKQNAIKLMDETTLEMDKMLNEAYDEEMIGKLDDIIAKSAIFNIARSGDLLKLVEGQTTLKDLIALYEGKVGNLKYVAENLSKVFLDEDTTGQSGIKQNIQQYNVTRNVTELEILSTLYSLNKIESSEDILIDLFKSHREIYNRLISQAIAIKTMDDELHAVSGDIKITRGNLIDDIPINNYELRAITYSEYRGRMFTEENGWKLLETRIPTAGGKLGIVYRERTDGLQEGMGTNISYIKTGIPLTNEQRFSEEYQNFDKNAFIDGIGLDGTDVRLLQLTSEEKKILGYYNDPVKSLLRAYAHKSLLLETNVIRNALVDGFTYIGTNKTVDVINKELEALIDDSNHPIYIKMPENIGIRDLSKKVRNEYRNVDDTLLSDVGGFKNKVDLIRKDIAYQVEGYKEDNLGITNHKVAVTLNRVKDLIRYIKINMIILNAPKITMDLVSAISVILAKGASFEEVYRYSKEAVKYSKEMTDLRNKRLELLLKKRGSTDEIEIKKYEEAVRAVDKEIAMHPFSAAHANGFIQSLGTEMLVKDRESISGLQVEMDKVLDKLTVLPNGEQTRLAKAVMKFAKFGLNSEVIYAYLGDKLEGHESVAKIGKLVKTVADDIAAIKNKDDAKGYLGMLIATPNSTFVRFGGALTLYADLIPRWVLYRHNINSGMSEAEAIQDSLTTIPDYKVNMPKGLKFMSDLYLMPFPSFFTRIQAVLANLAVKNPVSLSTHLLENALLGAHGQNILESNIFTKFNKDSIFTSPFDAISPSNMIPYINIL
jgi:hypothetical protein